MRLCRCLSIRYAIENVNTMLPKNTERVVALYLRQQFDARCNVLIAVRRSDWQSLCRCHPITELWSRDESMTHNSSADDAATGGIFTCRAITSRGSPSHNYWGKNHGSPWGQVRHLSMRCCQTNQFLRGQASLFLQRPKCSGVSGRGHTNRVIKIRKYVPIFSSTSIKTNTNALHIEQRLEYDRPRLLEMTVEGDFHSPFHPPLFRPSCPTPAHSFIPLSPYLSCPPPLVKKGKGAYSC